MRTSSAIILAVLAVVPSATVAFQQPAAIRYSSVAFTKNALPTVSAPMRSSSTSLVMAVRLGRIVEER